MPVIFRLDRPRLLLPAEQHGIARPIVSPPHTTFLARDEALEAITVAPSSTYVSHPLDIGQDHPLVLVLGRTTEGIRLPGEFREDNAT